MHFNFAFVLMFLSITSTASPLSSTGVTRLDLPTRKSLINFVIGIAFQVVKDIVTDLVDFNSNMHAAQTNFTQQTVISLRSQLPAKNVLVFHNPKSSYKLSPDAVHVHQELDIGLGFTRGYDIWVFDSGTFSLAGEGGYENWALAGCFSGPRTRVVFIKEC